MLFILIDTLRADRLSSYGYERATSPALDLWAASGVRFDRHLSQSSWTKCSMASMWTGMYPLRTGVTRFDDMLPEDAVMPAEILREAGFDTVGLYRNGWVSPNFGFGQGFDVYTRPAPMPPRPGLRLENPTVKVGGTDDDVIETAIEYLRVNGQKKWFLYLHMMDVHEYMYDDESALFGGEYSDVYDNSIRRVDSLLEFLLQYLVDAGLDRKTLVIIGSDHGEAFRERGIEGHARRVFRETTEVPLYMGFPFRLEPGIVVRGRTRNVDVWPTVLDLLGLEVPEGIDGRSVVDDIIASARGEIAPDDTQTGVAFIDTTWGRSGVDPLPEIAATQGDYRYLRTLSESGDPASESLFDAGSDPRELSNVAATEAEQLARMRAIVDEHAEVTPPWGQAPSRELSEMELNQLRALGYAIP